MFVCGKWKCRSFLAIHLLLCNALGAMPINMPRGYTELSHDIYDVHMWVFYICLGIMFVVFGGMFYILTKFRRSEKRKSLKGQVVSSGNVWVELIWTVIPTIIVIIMIIPATRLLLKAYDTRDADVVIRVIGHQWWWEYEYPRYNVRFDSRLIQKSPQDPDYLREVDHHLVLPVDKKIQFIITSEDVIHSWWVPELGIKQDAVPLTPYSVWATIEKEGTFYGKCAELCGALHGFMPIVVEAVTQDQFEQFIHDQQTPSDTVNKEESDRVAVDDVKKEEKNKKVIELDDLQSRLASGKTQYTETCVACHQANGTGVPPVFPSLVDSDKVGKDDPCPIIDILLHGVQGTAMEAFESTLGRQGIADVLTYIRSWQNKGAVSKSDVDNWDKCPKEVGGK